MKKSTKIISCALGAVMSASCAVGLCGCQDGSYEAVSNYVSNDLAEPLAVALLGQDIFAWNAFAVTPKSSFGYSRPENYTPSWYSYYPITKSDAKEMADLFDQINDELKKFNVSRMNETAALDYRALIKVCESYSDYYGSPNIVDLDLISGSYIDSEGGYVASFADSVENYVFRTKEDIEDLLDVTISTDDAFDTYIDYAADRAEHGYPLYDYTICAMQDYLDDVIDAGDDYYLYSYINDKIDAVNFLTTERKSYYKLRFKTALDGHFMTGVKTLRNGLDLFKGKVTTTTRGYLASYGSVGREYYTWRFNNLTGLNVSYHDFEDIYEDLATEAFFYGTYADDIITEIAALEETAPETFKEFYAYKNGEKGIMDMTTPQQMLEYLREAAKNIVPDLATVPEIGFKYMDETVAGRTSALAYYVRSPIDENNSNEYITLNPTTNNPAELLTTIAHEGYPGHLYAHVKAKEQGVGLLPTVMSCTAFSEGWSNYTELAVWDHIMSTTDNEALQLYCDYSYCDMYSGYLGMLLRDLEINYFGYDVSDYVELGLDEDAARGIIEVLMEMPATYVPYGYGMYYINSLHETAQKELGEKYNEVEFNGKLLSEGFGPTLERAKELTDEYIKSKK
ncbi:MAG: DUF885 domain-containing protein [Clostridiales bacterium]|nr:DUF885 domain-containing protein [Clostridiales bacterium]